MVTSKPQKDEKFSLMYQIRAHLTRRKKKETWKPFFLLKKKFFPQMFPINHVHVPSYRRKRCRICRDEVSIFRKETKFKKQNKNMKYSLTLRYVIES